MLRSRVHGWPRNKAIVRSGTAALSSISPLSIQSRSILNNNKNNMSESTEQVVAVEAENAIVSATLSLNNDLKSAPSESNNSENQGEACAVATAATPATTEGHNSAPKPSSEKEEAASKKPEEKAERCESTVSSPATSTPQPQLPRIDNASNTATTTAIAPILFFVSPAPAVENEKMDQSDVVVVVKGKSHDHDSTAPKSSDQGQATPAPTTATIEKAPAGTVTTTDADKEGESETAKELEAKKQSADAATQTQGQPNSNSNDSQQQQQQKSPPTLSRKKKNKKKKKKRKGSNSNKSADAKDAAEQPPVVDDHNQGATNESLASPGETQDVTLKTEHEPHKKGGDAAPKPRGSSPSKKSAKTKTSGVATAHKAEPADKDKGDKASSSSEKKRTEKSDKASNSDVHKREKVDNSSRSGDVAAEKKSAASTPNANGKPPKTSSPEASKPKASVKTDTKADKGKSSEPRSSGEASSKPSSNHKKDKSNHPEASSSSSPKKKDGSSVEASKSSSGKKDSASQQQQHHHQAGGKKDTSSSGQENKPAEEAADDGEWATVAVKPRGKRGGGKKSSSGGGSPKNSNSNSNNKGSSNGNSNNGGGGRNGNNSNNNNNGGKNNNNNNNNDHDSSHHGRNRHGRRRNRDKNRNQTSNNNNNNNSSNQTQQQNPSQQQKQQQQQQQQQQHLQNNKMVKDVIIAHILDAVDKEVARRGAGHSIKPQAGNNVKSLDDSKKSRSGNDSKRLATSSASASNNKQGQQGQNKDNQWRKQSSSAGGSNVAPTPPPSSVVSNSSARSVRDILVGASSSETAAKHSKAAESAAVPDAWAKSKAKEEAVEPVPVKKSKVKPGISYKAMIEPDQPKPQQPPPQPQAKAQPPKPKVSAWGKKLPAEIKPDNKSGKAYSDIANAEKKQEQPLQPVEKKAWGKPSAGQSGLGQVPAATEKKAAEKVGKPVVPKGRSLAELADKFESKRATSAAENTEGNCEANVAVRSKLTLSKQNSAAFADTKKIVEACGTSASATEEDGAEADDGASPHPPLSTLLGNSNSATSSVASSLEAPHASNRFRHQGSSNLGGEDDVGYHLLNVCGQLSEEINIFMGRRSLALDVRRRERTAVLSALGDTLGKIWPGQCHVEKYGSCATQLDLPSSDLDLVVCGLDDVLIDHNIPMTLQPMMNAQPTMSGSLHNNSSNSFRNDSSSSFQNEVEAGGGEMVQQQPMSPSPQLGDRSFSGSVTQESVIDPPSSPYEESVAEGGDLKDNNMVPDESADGTVMAVEYSPGGSVAAESYAENYPPEYHDSSNQQEMVGMEPYSSDVYSYHSTPHADVSMATGVAEAYSPRSYHAEDGTPLRVMEGYGVVHQDYQVTPSNEQFYYAAPNPYNYVSPGISLNAQRVMRLAAELELQPWAVQVKAIPTATVPVVKMLADPSRLPGLMASGGGGEGGNWMYAAAQAGAAVDGIPPPPIVPEQMSPAVFSSAHQITAQWRGTDIKNGLQPVDITFEGPEHGGIGSTTYSQRIVQDACEETGLPAESTPVVQAASVLKELLAQRRLNEPFSGGLSSYGLMLLLLAVLKDRRIIREEMLKVERQRMKVSSDSNEEGAKSSLKLQHRDTEKGQKNSPGADSIPSSSTASKQASSSWASVAKKSNVSSTTGLTESSSTTNDSETTAKTGGVANYSQVAQQKASREIGTNKYSVNEEVGKDHSLTKTQAGPDHQSNLDSNDLVLPEETTTQQVEKEKPALPQSSNLAPDGPAVLSQFTPSSVDEDCISNNNRLASTTSSASIIPQGSNDVFEVLCSGELTSGKLLMHFLLFYGQHFDAASTLIDINGTHHPQYGTADPERLSPFVARPPGGTIDPITGMFSVDTIVVYDPLEGAMDHNVAKRCYCWNNVRWVFAQCYMTVSSIVETSDAMMCGLKKSSSLHHHQGKNEANTKKSSGDGEIPRNNDKPNEKQLQPLRSTSTSAGATADVVTPILELLLSF